MHYLKRNVQMPLIEILLEYGEEELIIEARDGIIPELFSEDQFQKIMEFSKVMKNLPEESSEFWSYDSINGKDWKDLRSKAKDLLSYIK